MISKSKWLSLVIISTAAIIFVSINSLMADKPISWEWSVTIPGESNYYNLYAFAPGGKDFPNSDKYYVGVEQSKRKRPPFNTDFQFYIRGYLPDLTNNDKIGFQFPYGNLELRDNTNIEDKSCSFPGFGKCPNDAEAPGCMQSFLAQNLHPYSVEEGVPNLNDYTYLWIRITLDVDIEQITEASVYPSGRIYIDLIKSDYVLPNGCEDFHNLVISRDVAAGSKIIAITRSDTNTWDIVVDTTIIASEDDPEGGTIRFTEAYWGFSGKGKGRLETKKPLKAKAPFKFTTTWTRTQL